MVCRRSMPIGILDSGVGGLTVLREIIKLLPGEDIIYIGDTANVPYGDKKAKDIYNLSERLIDFLLSAKVKTIVVACHTVSVALRRFFSSPEGEVKILDIIHPTVDFLLKRHYSIIGLIGSKATVDSGIFPKNLAPARVLQHPCPNLVSVVEKGDLSSEETRQEVERCISRFRKEDKIEILVLACTHYPFLMGIIREYLPSGIEILDPAKLQAAEVKRYLWGNTLANEKASGSARRDIFFTRLSNETLRIAQSFLGPISANYKELSL